MKGFNISEKVVEYILSRKIDEFETLDVNSVSRVLDINRSYLSKKFKSEKNCSLSEYIFFVKILRSVCLLEVADELSVERLSTIMGFGSVDYFIRVFKQKVGTTPGRFRKNYKQIKSSKLLDLH
jgi:YesN/AraC family two-component response regulator